MVSCSLQTDTSVRSIQTRICRMTCAPSGAALVSRQRPHWSLIPRFSQQHSTLNCSALYTSLPCVACYAHPCFVFYQNLCAPSPLAFVAPVSWMEGDFDAGSVATCITSRQKLCCCLGIDINWPFQKPSKQRAFVCSASLLVYSRGCWKTMHTACRMKPLALVQYGWND